MRPPVVTLVANSIELNTAHGKGIAEEPPGTKAMKNCAEACPKQMNTISSNSQ